MTKIDVSQNKKASTLSQVSEKASIKEIADSSQPATSEDLPYLADVLSQHFKPEKGGVLEYPETDIQFHNPISAVKSLQVAICSSEQEDISVLHKIHLMTRI